MNTDAMMHFWDDTLPRAIEAAADAIVIEEYDDQIEAANDIVASLPCDVTLAARALHAMDDAHEATGAAYAAADAAVREHIATAVDDIFYARDLEAGEARRMERSWYQAMLDDQAADRRKGY